MVPEVDMNDEAQILIVARNAAGGKEHDAPNEKSTHLNRSPDRGSLGGSTDVAMESL